MVVNLATRQTLTEIKRCVEGCVGKHVVLRTNIGKRNAREKRGVVKATYPSVFVVTVNEGMNSQRRVSYSYCDILTETVEVTICATEERISVS